MDLEIDDSDEAYALWLKKYNRVVDTLIKLGFASFVLSLVACIYATLWLWGMPITDTEAILTLEDAGYQLTVLYDDDQRLGCKGMDRSSTRRFTATREGKAMDGYLCCRVFGDGCDIIE